MPGNTGEMKQTVRIPASYTCFIASSPVSYTHLGVLASVRIGGVNVTVDLYQNFSECWQRLLEHTSRCRSIFDFHILLSGTAVELCVVLSSPKGTYTAHLIFNVRKRS